MVSLPKWLRKTAVLLEMIKFEHSVFALPFAYAGLFLAEGGLPGPSLFVLVTAAMVSFRTMAMGANRLLDAEIDRLNPRTEGRALPAGKISRKFTWGFTGVSFAGFELCAWALGPLCLFLSPVPVLLAWVYPVMKRFTWLSHLVLGMILGIAPYGAWLAGCGRFDRVPALITAGVAAWVAGFDIIYALQDIDFDRRLRLHSFPARFGIPKSFLATQILHGIALAAWGTAGLFYGLGGFFFAGLAACALFLVREHRLARSLEIGKIEEAFFAMNAGVSAVLFLSVAADLWLRKGLP